jgi:hypothetical protein
MRHRGVGPRIPIVPLMHLSQHLMLILLILHEGHGLVIPSGRRVIVPRVHRQLRVAPWLPLVLLDVARTCLNLVLVLPLLLRDLAICSNPLLVDRSQIDS